MTENKEAGTLKINATQKGDAFPAAETLIADAKGNQFFIGVSRAQAGGSAGPYVMLPGNNDRSMMSANFTVSMDKNGVFTGVQQGDNKYSVSDWNKMMQNTPLTPPPPTMPAPSTLEF